MRLDNLQEGIKDLLCAIPVDAITMWNYMHAADQKKRGDVAVLRYVFVAYSLNRFFKTLANLTIWIGNRRILSDYSLVVTMSD